MLPRFFIDRPIFAWVIALIIMIVGALGLSKLAVEQYPTVAPPTVSVNVAYPGASAKMIEETVIELLEREINGTPKMIYMESSALANGTGSIALSFEPGTDGDAAQIEVQNRIARVQPRLPAIVSQNGVRVDQARSNLLMVVAMLGEKQEDLESVADYASRSVVPELQRIKGMGQVTMYASERAMRVWIDPEKLQAFSLSAAEVNAAIREQNSQISAGTLGDTPFVTGQSTNATVVVPGQLKTVEEFQRIVLRDNGEGATVRLGDVARIELGVQSYANSANLNGKPAVMIGLMLSNNGNAITVANEVRERMATLEKYFPKGMSWKAPYTTDKFVKISIQKVAMTLAEAMLLVFLVMFLFLQNWRYTIIPTIVVPIALLGTFAVLQVLGYSVNVLTMFGMVLVIGIVVDDAIVVVENVERVMREEGLGPVAATRRAMDQISGAVIGMTLVLVSVFVPLTFFSGAVGNIYRQFAVVMASSIAFSGIMALILTPALCATLLKPIDEQAHSQPTGFFGRFFAGFNRVFDRNRDRYTSTVSRFLGRSMRMAMVYVLLLGVGIFVMLRLPSGFIPSEDQGTMFINLQLPPGATLERTTHTLAQAEKVLLAQPEVANVVTVKGFSFSGQGQNTAFGFISLKDWSERTGPGQDASSVAARVTGQLSSLSDGFVLAMNPPAIPALGRISGFAMRLQDRNGQGQQALLAARNQLVGLAMKSPILAGVRAEGIEDAPQLQLDINRDLAAAQGVSMAAINTVLSTSLGSTYVNDFQNAGRLQRVIVQADGPARMDVDGLMRLPVLNRKGQAVLLGTLVTPHWISGPMMTVRYNGYPTMRITGAAAPGHSSGDAMNEMERLVTQLPPGFGFEWSGQSREEKIAGSSAIYVYLFAVLAVFLLLSALYESWSIPFAVLLSVPLGLLGVAAGVWLRGMENDVYFQIGLVTIIGLSAKNAILIVEFAKDLQASGMSALQAASHAAHMRFRPILMTSFAFMLGVVPLYFSSGASSAAQRAIGTGVFWGMVVGTLLAVFFVPTFYVLVRHFFPVSELEAEHAKAHALATGIGSGAPH